MSNYATIITNGQQAKGTKHGPTVAFVCADCGETKPTGGLHGIGTGYARDDKDNLICYQCCGKRDEAALREDGNGILYLTMERGKQAHVSNWPGTLKRHVLNVRKGDHNMARYRYDVWFTMPDDKMLWHGVTYGDNTQICHVRRTKTVA